MAIQIDIAGQDALAELLAHIDAGEDVVLLMRDGETVAVAHKPEPPPPRIERIPGMLAHLGPMDDPYIFTRPDPEFVELAESHDEDHFYRPLPPNE